MIASRPDTSRTFPPRPGSVAQARRIAHRFAADRPEAYRERLLLVVSELVTNAVIHAATDLELTLAAGDGGILVSVTDSGPDFDPDIEFPASHRGLRIVESVAGRPRLSRHRKHKTVSVVVA
jgi:anti-sigma regulatory factor (Ser/Thr protein kinase)